MKKNLIWSMYEEVISCRQTQTTCHLNWAFQRLRMDFVDVKKYRVMVFLAWDIHLIFSSFCKIYPLNVLTLDIVIPIVMLKVVMKTHLTRCLSLYFQIMASLKTSIVNIKLNFQETLLKEINIEFVNWTKSSIFYIICNFMQG